MHILRKIYMHPSLLYVKTHWVYMRHHHCVPKFQQFWRRHSFRHDFNHWLCLFFSSAESRHVPCVLSRFIVCGDYFFHFVKNPLSCDETFISIQQFYIIRHQKQPFLIYLNAYAYSCVCVNSNI